MNGYTKGVVKGALGICLLCCAQLMAAEPDKKTTQEKEEKQLVKPESPKRASNQLATLPTYVPPFRGAPRHRIGGATRDGDKLHIVALSPGHAGLTINRQPRLYFLANAPKDARLEFTLVPKNAEEPLIETEFSSNGEKMQWVDTSSFNVKLERNVDYRWYITIIVNPRVRANDIVSGGIIRYQPPSQKLALEMSSASSDELSGVLARHGVWYDAVGATQSSHQPKDQLIHLIAQVGLSYSR